MAMDILMGDYEIFCDKNKSQWRVWDRLSSNERDFPSLASMLRYLEKELEAIEIEK
jgi:hypothetical protein